MWLYHYEIGSWSNDSGDGNKNGKKAIGLQNNNFAGAFFCARGSALFHVLSRTQDNDFLFLFLNFDNSTSTIFNNFQQNLPTFGELNELE